MKNTLQNIPSHLGTILSTSLMLFLFGLIMTTLFLASSLSEQMQENMRLSVVLKQDLTDDEATRLADELLAITAVKSVVYIGKEQEIEEVTKELNLSKNLVEVLGYNPLFPLMEIHLNAGYANNDSIASFEETLKNHKNVVNLQYHSTEIEMLNRNITRIMLILSALCAVFLFIVIVLISNTVRLNIYSHRFLFNTMKLVGADRSFIVSSIVRQQMINGVIAAIPVIAVLLYIQHYLNSTMGVNITHAMFYISFLTLIVGIIITGCAAYFAAIRYLKRNTTDLHHI